nr:ankyrin repeat and MYND domain-containing protein 1 [Aotus nancymaae]
MDGGRASLSFDDGASGADGPQRPLDGKGGETPHAEEPGSLRSHAVFASRCGGASGREARPDPGPGLAGMLLEASGGNADCVTPRELRKPGHVSATTEENARGCVSWLPLQLASDLPRAHSWSGPEGLDLRSCRQQAQAGEADWSCLSGLAASPLSPSRSSSLCSCPSRDVSEASEKEEEESAGPPRVQDLKEAHLQLVQGVQEWQDGCVYRGEFGLNTKLGYGEFSWPTGESYRGQFYRDHRHGLGTYMWPDGSSFTGTFYLSHREGYGALHTKTQLFKGLYKADQRFGPGVETYADGSQDVGLWFRGHLIKLCAQSPGGFSLLSYPEFSSFLTHSPARISLSEEEETEWGLQEGQDPFFYEYQRLLLHDDLTLPPEMDVYSTDSEHLPMASCFRHELDARIFLSDIPPLVEDGEPWFITNETPLLVKIQKQTYKFRNKPAHTSWNMGAVLEGKRSGFALCGPKERLAMEMIVKAEEGNYDWIYGVLKDDFASADVADAKGYTVLAAAATHCHNRIVNLLLDYGADVNKCSDEGLTPLSMCFLLYYPARSFKPNIAERTMPKPQVSPPWPPRHALSPAGSSL